MRQWLIGIALVLTSLASCAEAVDGQPTDLPGPSPVVGSTKDAGATADSTVPVDSDAPEDTSPGEDTSIADTGSADIAAAETGELDTGAEDTALPDTFVPPVDTGPGGACMYCSTGTCPLPLADYGCLLNCLLDGYLDCHYDPAASMPCTCKL